MTERLDDRDPYPTGDATPLLPEWYMPAPELGASRASRGHKAVAWLIVVSCVAVPAVGLCNTFGELVIA